jgi:hypothetical protein
MCAKWSQSYAAFLADMGRRPGPDFSLDRINNDGDYEPGNCRWATADQQYANTRQTLRRPATSAGTTQRKNGRWQAQASSRGRNVYLGSFDTAAQASAAYRIFCASLTQDA